MVGPAAVRVYHLRPARAGCRLQLGRWGQARLESLHDLSEGGGRAPKALGGGRLLPSLATARPLLGSEGGRYLGRGSRDGEGPGCGCSGGKQQRQEQEHYRRGSHFVVCNVDPCNVWGWNRLPVVMYGGGGLATKARARVSLTKFV